MSCLGNGCLWGYSSPSPFYFLDISTSSFWFPFPFFIAIFCRERGRRGGNSKIEQEQLAHTFDNTFVMLQVDADVRHLLYRLDLLLPYQKRQSRESYKQDNTDEQFVGTFRSHAPSRTLWSVARAVSIMEGKGKEKHPRNVTRVLSGRACVLLSYMC